MGTITFGSFQDALRTALGNRAGLSGVAVWFADPGPDNVEREAIVFQSISVTDEWHSMGRNVAERYRQEGQVRIVKAGNNQTQQAAARDRCIAIIDQIRDQLLGDGTVSGSVKEAHLAAVTYQSRVFDDSVMCDAAFTIEVEAY